MFYNRFKNGAAPILTQPHHKNVKTNYILILTFYIPYLTRTLRPEPSEYL